MADPRRGATKDDATLGERIRARRIALRMSQKTLGEALGVSFQQIQQYEKGKDRLSGARLMKVAEVLELDIGKLLANGAALSPAEVSGIEHFMASKDGALLAHYYLQLDAPMRRVVLNLAKSLAKMGEAPPAKRK